MMSTQSYSHHGGICGRPACRKSGGAAINLGITEAQLLPSANLTQ